MIFPKPRLLFQNGLCSNQFVMLGEKPMCHIFYMHFQLHKNWGGSWLFRIFCPENLGLIFFKDLSLSRNLCQILWTYFYGNIINILALKSMSCIFQILLRLVRNRTVSAVACCYRCVWAIVAGCNSKHVGCVTTNWNAIFAQTVTRIGLKFCNQVSMVKMHLHTKNRP